MDTPSITEEDLSAARVKMQQFKAAIPDEAASEEEVKKADTLMTPLPTKPKIPGVD